MTWPRKIFLESTALFQLGPRLENVDFAKLLSYRDVTKADLFVTEVNRCEYLRFRKREIRQTRSRLQEANRDLDKYAQNYAEFDSVLKRLDIFFSEIEQYFGEKFKSLGIHILPVPKLDVETLVRMGVDGTPPFDKPKEHPGEKSSEKGFRDSVIMFSILEEVRNRPEDHALVVTDDELLSEGFRVHTPSFSTVVFCVDGIPAANKHIEKGLTASYKEHLRYESEEARNLLLHYKDVLEAKVAEIREIEATDLGGLFGVVKDENGQSLTIESVLSVRFSQIEAALWKERDQPRSKILFRVACDATVIASYPRASMLTFPKYPLGARAVYSHLTGAPPPFEKVIPIFFYGQASITKKEENWALEDLTIDRKMPEMEDFLDLMSAKAPDVR
jgi:hypothetical protein